MDLVIKSFRKPMIGKEVMYKNKTVFSFFAHEDLDELELKGFLNALDFAKIEYHIKYETETDDEYHKTLSSIKEGNKGCWE